MSARTGLALMEVLVALAVLAVGLGAVLRLQTTLRAGTDLARQQAEALRLAQASHEDLRAITGAGDGATITGLADTDVTPAGANARYLLQRTVTTGADPLRRQVATTLAWTDRAGQPQQLRLHTLLNPFEPQLGAALALDRSPAPASPGQAARHPGVPIEARSLGDGRSALKPRAAELLTWLFDDRTGQLVAQCDSTAGLPTEQLTAASLANCRAVGGLLLRGRVRFALDTDTPGSAEAQNPLSAALPLDLRVTLSSTGHPTPGWTCSDDAPDTLGGAPTQLSVAYVCVVSGVVSAGSTAPRWSGRLDLVPVGWTLAAGGASGYRVCRYSADHDRNGRIDNPEHPAAYASVDGPLGDQNFLIVRAAAACPVDTNVSPVLGVGGNWLDDGTVAHQP